MFKHLAIIALVLLLAQPWEVEGGKKKQPPPPPEPETEEDHDGAQDEESNVEKDIACTADNWDTQCKKECPHKKNFLTTCTYVEGAQERLFLNNIDTEMDERGGGKNKNKNKGKGKASPNIKCVCRQSQVPKNNKEEEEEEKEEDNEKNVIRALVIPCEQSNSKATCKTGCKGGNDIKYVRCSYQTFADLTKLYLPKSRGHAEGAKGACFCVKVPK